MSSPQILDQLAQDMGTLLKEPTGSRRVKITDLTPRDGQQCKLATRVTTDDLLPLCASIDKCGFYAVEVWGGATFDVCMRYLKEDPWERLRRIKAVMPNTKLQMLLRGQHILAYRPYTDKIVYKFVERAVANGMNVFRVFEATNDFRNIEVATKAVKEFGGEAHVEVNYTVSPVHTLEKWMEYAEQLMEIGADWLSLKDATGILTPFDSYRIIKGIKDIAKDKLPVLLHCHDMGGTSSMSHLMAILAGVDMIDTVMSPLSFGSAHPATETMVERTEECFDLKPDHLAGDVAYGTGKTLGRLVERGIDPHIPVWDKSERNDSTLSRQDFAYDSDRDGFWVGGWMTGFVPGTPR